MSKNLQLLFAHYCDSLSFILPVCSILILFFHSSNFPYHFVIWCSLTITVLELTRLFSSPEVFHVTICSHEEGVQSFTLKIKQRPIKANNFWLNSRKTQPYAVNEPWPSDCSHILNLRPNNARRWRDILIIFRHRQALFLLAYAHISTYTHLIGIQSKFCLRAIRIHTSETGWRFIRGTVTARFLR